jgi:hypothetical protein
VNRAVDERDQHGDEHQLRPFMRRDAAGRRRGNERVELGRGEEWRAWV